MFYFISINDREYSLKNVKQSFISDEMNKVKVKVNAEFMYKDYIFILNKFLNEHNTYVNKISYYEEDKNEEKYKLVQTKLKYIVTKIKNIENKLIIELEATVDNNINPFEIYK